MKRLIAILVAGLLLCVCITGCAGNETSGDSVSAAEETKAGLEVWTFYDRNIPGYYYMFLWDDLAREYGVEIQVRNYPTVEMENRLSLALVSGELPDVFFCDGGSSLKPFVDAGVCEPVDRFLAGLSLAEGYGAAYGDGAHYVIPCIVEDYAVVYYDTEVLQTLGTGVPGTWEELEEMIQRIKAYNQKHHTDYSAISFGGKDGYEGGILLDLLTLQGGREEAARKILRLHSLGAYSADCMETGDEEATTNFIHHRSAMLVSRASSLSHLIWNMGGTFRAGVFPGETKKDGSYTMMKLGDGAPSGLCIHSESEKKELAGRICAEYLRRVNAENVKTGVKNMFAENTETAEAVPRQRQELRAMIEGASKIRTAPAAALDREEKRSLRAVTKDLFGGRITVEEFIKSLDS